jgi:hypothetical protein
MGAFILMQLISGIFMVLPASWFGPQPKPLKAAMDYRGITLSPADALLRLDRYMGKPVHVQSLNLRPIGDRVLYEIQTPDGETQFIDAVTGAYFPFTPELATAIARERFGLPSSAAEVTKLTGHERSYPWGPLPVFRVHFHDNPSTTYFVSPQSSKIYSSTPLTRLRGAITSLHELAPVELLIDNRVVRKGLLILLACVSLVGAAIGYYLAFSPRSRPARERVAVAPGNTGARR